MFTMSILYTVNNDYTVNHDYTVHHDYTVYYDYTVNLDYTVVHDLTNNNNQYTLDHHNACRVYQRNHFIAQVKSYLNERIHIQLETSNIL